MSVTRHFNVLDPQAAYVLRIKNAGVTADITLNGTKIPARPKDSKSGVVARPVTLLAENQLSLELRGPRGSHLTLQITGTDSVPPIITAIVTPIPNDAGWNNTDVTVSFSCEDATSGIESCSAPVTLSSEGAAQLVTGTARDRAGNTAEASVTINIDKTPPQLAITSPSPGAVVDTPSLTVTGTVSDALSGIASVTCDGAPASLSAETFTCSLNLVPGSNTITASATDLAGNPSSATIEVSLAQALDDIPPEQLQNFLNTNNIDSAAKFLERLPEEYKEHWIMMTFSESAQKGTATEPRLLLPSADSSKVFSFCTGEPCGSGENFIEYLQFDKFEDFPNEFRNKFRFHEIDFPDGKPAEVKVDDPDCRNCHFTNPRPNWDAYDNWAGMLPFNRDRIYQGSEEEKSFKRLFEHLQDDPIIKKLKLPDKVTRGAGGLITIIPDFSDPGSDPGGEKTVFYIEENGLPKYTGCFPTPGTNCKPVNFIQGGNFLTLHHSREPSSDQGRGVVLFDQLSGYNARRVAQELIDFLNDPMVNPRKVDIRPIALAIADGCVTAANLSDFASETAQAAFRGFHNVSSFDELGTKTNEARHSLPQRKANLLAQNLKGLIEAEDLNPILPTPENITKEVAQRSLSASPLLGSYTPDTLTGFMIDREDYGEDTTIALFRFFLEPWGKVQVVEQRLVPWVQTWSMGVRLRSDTYTFADVFSRNITPPYRPEIIDRLRKALLAENKEVTCDALKTASKQAFDAALPLPVFCGDGVVTPPEQCDDRNITNGDGCSATCTTELPPPILCGDGTLNPPEQCDDGNTMNFDGCSSTCKTEAFFPIQQIFNDSSNGCLSAGCHDSTAAGGLNLTSGSARDNLVNNVPSITCSGKVRVKPNEPDNSCLFLKVIEAPPPGVVGQRMPIGFPPLDATEIGKIEGWIKDGALP